MSGAFLLSFLGSVPEDIYIFRAILKGGGAYAVVFLSVQLLQTPMRVIPLHPLRYRNPIRRLKLAET